MAVRSLPVLVVVVALLTGCYRGLPTPPQVVATAAPVTTTHKRPSLAQLTPPEVFGAVLGMSRDALLRARRAARLDPERYDFRDHYVETIDRDGIEAVHYYTLKDGGALYQISFDFTAHESGRDGRGVEQVATRSSTYSETMWRRYVTLGRQIEDLGGRETVIAGYPFEIRVWFNDNRLQLMAVIEGSEWWSQYGRDVVDHDDVDPP